MRVLGIDTSLRSTGLGVVESAGTRLRAVEFGPVRNAPALALSACLRRIDAEVDALIERTRPEAASVEGAFFCKNARTAMVLGQARGAAIAACARRGLPVFEYAPRRVKQAVVGYGDASKEQVLAMVTTLLALDGEPQEDAGEALALAICHVHSFSRLAALRPEPV